MGSSALKAWQNKRLVSQEMGTGVLSEEKPTKTHTYTHTNNRMP